MAGAALKSPSASESEFPVVNDGFLVPVALFNFNRPHLTRQVFEIVRKIKPRQLLLVADGPRSSRPDDFRLCAEVRAIFDEIDWDCEVSRNFSETNLGSFKRNSSGLNWVFDTVKEAIILEDDCIPSLSFFRYCEELLDRYRDDPRVSVISGNNFGFLNAAHVNDSYFFSAYTFTWGWASWRRVWREVDLSMLWWESETGKEVLSSLFPRPAEWRYWHRLYENIRNGQVKNAWDYQLLLSSFKLSQCCAIPQVNLVSNIGFGADGTNCTDESSSLQAISRGEMRFPLAHPVDVQRSALVDHAIFNAIFQATLWQRAKNKLARIIMHVRSSVGF